MAELSLSRSQLLLLAGTANRPLAEEMAGHLGQPLCALTIRRFADGEIFVKIDENVRGRDVFIIQPTNPPAENLVELLLMIDAARRASAARITAVLPYFGYARQDRKDQPRVAISAKLMANLITHAGAVRVPRAPVGTRRGAVARGAGRRGRGDQHDPHPRRAALREAPGAVDRGPDGEGDRVRALEPVGELAV